MGDYRFTELVEKKKALNSIRRLLMRMTGSSAAGMIRTGLR